MVKENRKPELIVIAGPNGSGKTSVTQRFLHHEWADGTVYINPDEVAREKFGEWNFSRYYKSIANCHTVSSMVDRLYVYANSVDNEDAKLLFRLSNGVMGKKSMMSWDTGTTA